MAEKLQLIKEEVIEWVKKFVLQNQNAVVGTAAFITVVGLVNIFRNKTNTTEQSKRLNRSSKSKHNKQQSSDLKHSNGFQTDNQSPTYITKSKKPVLITKQPSERSERQADYQQQTFQQHKHQNSIQDTKDKLFFQMFRNLGLTKSTAQ